MAIRTLIVDDEPPARNKLRALLTQEKDLEIVGEAKDGDEAVKRIGELKPDLVFLDVQMPELDGFGVLRALPADSVPAVIFVTAHDAFALKAFEVHAIDYLLKPFDRSRLAQALDHARQILQRRQSGRPDSQLVQLLAELESQQSSRPLDRIAVKDAGRILLVKIKDVDWIQAADNYVELHAGKTTHLHRETLTALEARLSPDQFVRISRSVVVNIERIRELQPLFHGDYSVLLQDGTQLTLTRSYRSKLSQLLDKEE